MVTTSHLTLADARRLDYRVSGPEGGLPLVFHHGTPGSLAVVRAFERAAHARGLRFVTLSRPGYGESTRKPGRRVVDVVADTEAVLSAIGSDSCVVAGWSGGGPHALACAARLPGTLAALVIAGVGPATADDLAFLEGMGQDNLDEFGEAAAGEEPLRAYLDKVGAALAVVEPGDIVAEMSSLLPEADRRVLTEEFAEDTAESFHEGLRVGIDGWLDDDLAFLDEWGFDLGEIAIPTMLWQGTDDLMVPIGHGRWFESHFPQATVTIVPGEGHLSISLGALEPMFDGLVAAAQR